MSKVLVIFRRELRSYFATPLAYVFIVIFLVLAAVFTFQVGGFFERGHTLLEPGTRRVARARGPSRARRADP